MRIKWANKNFRSFRQMVYCDLNDLYQAFCYSGVKHLSRRTLRRLS